MTLPLGASLRARQANRVRRPKYRSTSLRRYRFIARFEDPNLMGITPAASTLLHAVLRWQSQRSASSAGEIKGSSLSVMVMKEAAGGRRP